MPVSSTHQMIIDRIADKAVEAWTWAIGSDVNPSLLDGEAISEGHEAVRSAIRDDLDEVAQRAGQLGWSENTLRGNFFPQIWKTISGRVCCLRSKTMKSWRPAIWFAACSRKIRPLASATTSGSPTRNRSAPKSATPSSSNRLFGTTRLSTP